MPCSSFYSSSMNLIGTPQIKASEFSSTPGLAIILLPNMFYDYNIYKFSGSDDEWGRSTWMGMLIIVASLPKRRMIRRQPPYRLWCCQPALSCFLFNSSTSLWAFFMALLCCCPSALLSTTTGPSTWLGMLSIIASLPNRRFAEEAASLSSTALSAFLCCSPDLCFGLLAFFFRDLLHFCPSALLLTTVRLI